jgi:hypothetical protein
MRMTEEVESFEFCASEHATFLAGYLDAVGRTLTTDEDLWALTAREPKHALTNELVLGAKRRTQSIVENWSREFGSLVDNFLGIDQRSRLGFDLIEYICWFKEFMQNAECYKLECDPIGSASLGQAVYLIQVESGDHVLLVFQRLAKTHNKRLQPIGRKDAPSG